MFTIKLSLRHLAPLVLLATVAAASGCASPTDEGTDDGAPPSSEGAAPEMPEEASFEDVGEGEAIGTTESASSIDSCPNRNPGIELVSYRRAGNFDWETVIRDIKRDGKGAGLYVEITDVSAAWAGNHTRRYTQKGTHGCGTYSRYRYHIDAPICGRPGRGSLRVRMWLRNGGTTVSSREVYSYIDCRN